MPQKGVGWPFLAIIPGTPSQGIPKQLEFEVPERVYQVSQPAGVDNNIVQYYHIEKLLKIIAIYRY